MIFARNGEALADNQKSQIRRVRWQAIEVNLRTPKPFFPPGKRVALILTRGHHDGSLRP